MLVIRLQRTGRSGHAQFRVVVQDVRQTPTSGKVVASLGAYNPHAKELNIDIEKTKVFLANGAQPSGRLASLLEKQGIKLPKWVQLTEKKQKTTRNPEKLRKNQPADAKALADEPAKPEMTEDKPADAEAMVDKPADTEVVADKPADAEVKEEAQTEVEAVVVETETEVSEPAQAKIDAIVEAKTPTSEPVPAAEIVAKAKPAKK